MKYILLLLTSLFLTGCFFFNQNNQKTINEIKGEVFGSYYVIKYAGDLDKMKFEKVLSSFFVEFNQEFSTYQKDSVVSTFNTLKANEKLKVSHRFIEMFKLIKKLHLDTEGAFDPTFAPVIKLWGFGGAQKRRIPTDNEIKSALQKTGMKHIFYDEAKLEVWKNKSELSLDLNAFAPGWAADLIGLLLENYEIKNYMIDISGEIIAKGEKSPNIPWIIGIEKPSLKHAEGIQIALKLSDESISTSGNYRQFFDQNGKRINHILNPKTGKPVNHSICSASVISKDGISADAWSTAMMVLGEGGIKLAENKGLRVYLIKYQKEGKYTEISSRSMDEYLKSNKIN